MPNPLSIITPALELLGKNINILPATRETAVSPPRVADHHAQCKNIAHLMLRQEVVDAVKEGKFHP